MFHFKNRDRELQLKNIFGQMRALSKTANNDELRSMQSWLKCVNTLF
jgi:hypothetical protein